mgnify:CR=1 FL=1
MKKRIALILVVVLLCCFGLAACKARDEGEKKVRKGKNLQSNFK